MNLVKYTKTKNLDFTFIHHRLAGFLVGMVVVAFCVEAGAGVGAGTGAGVETGAGAGVGTGVGAGAGVGAVLNMLKVEKYFGIISK